MYICKLTKLSASFGVQVLCVPMTETLSWRLDLGWVADTVDGLSCRS